MHSDALDTDENADPDSNRRKAATLLSHQKLKLAVLAASLGSLRSALPKAFVPRMCVDEGF
jgi:predicted benzoate:H+ symporter BenE